MQTRSGDLLTARILIFINVEPLSVFSMSSAQLTISV
jgi:hypothetical protein